MYSGTPGVIGGHSHCKEPITRQKCLILSGSFWKRPSGPDAADPVPDSWAGASGSDMVSVGTWGQHTPQQMFRPPPADLWCRRPQPGVCVRANKLLAPLPDDNGGKTNKFIRPSIRRRFRALLVESTSVPKASLASLVWMQVLFHRTSLVSTGL